MKSFLGVIFSDVFAGDAHAPVLGCEAVAYGIVTDGFYWCGWVCESIAGDGGVVKFGILLAE